MQSTRSDWKRASSVLRITGTLLVELAVLVEVTTNRLMELSEDDS